MTTTTSVTDSSRSPSESPSISIGISTQISIFDLSINTPFVITVVLTLHYSNPITFRKTDTRFFLNPLQSPGLEFTNIRTRETQVGMRVDVCYFRSDDSDLPVEAYKKEWLTLFPGQPYTLDASIKQCAGEGGRTRTLAEQESGLEGRPTSLKWPMVHQLRDGETFEIKLNDGARVKRWFEGTLEEILHSSTEGKTPVHVERLIEFEVKSTARFKVKRPDHDGSLNWL
jgi:hypothetical protein